MRWLLHGSLTPAVTEALVRHGHSVAPLPAQEPPPGPNEILEHARIQQLDVLTTDSTLANAATTRLNRAVVYLQLQGGDIEQDDAIDRLFKRYKRLTPGRLYTLTASRVKVRQLPAKFNRAAANPAKEDREEDEGSPKIDFDLS